MFITCMCFANATHASRELCRQIISCCSLGNTDVKINKFAMNKRMNVGIAQKFFFFVPRYLHTVVPMHRTHTVASRERYRRHKSSLVVLYIRSSKTKKTCCSNKQHKRLYVDRSST